MDMQKLIDSMSAMGRVTRANYHLTLGALKEKLEALPPDAVVEFDDGKPIGEETSYRGYYDDLAFEDGGRPSLAAAVLEACYRALRGTYQGYRGGDFTYDDRTPLWRAPWGCCGPAIVGAIEQDGKLVLVTRDIP